MQNALPNPKQQYDIKIDLAFLKSNFAYILVNPNTVAITKLEAKGVELNEAIENFELVSTKKT